MAVPAACRDESKNNRKQNRRLPYTSFQIRDIRYILNWPKRPNPALRVHVCRAARITDVALPIVGVNYVECKLLGCGAN